MHTSFGLMCSVFEKWLRYERLSKVTLCIYCKYFHMSVYIIVSGVSPFKKGTDFQIVFGFTILHNYIPS